MRNKLTAGNPLPPRIQPPGCRRRLWPRAAVHEWLEQFMVTAAVRLGKPYCRARELVSQELGHFRGDIVEIYLR